MSMKNYLVTGGAGFIGSHLVEALKSQGDRVVVFDNFKTGKKENLSSDIEIIKGDICLDFTSELLKGIDGIFHLAAIPSVQFSIENPEETFKINVLGTLKILRAASLAKVEKVVFVSSAAVYGKAKNIPTKENDEIDPLSPYGLEKYIGEKYCRLFNKVYNLKTVSLRFANAYGPRMPESGAYRNVIKIFSDAKKNNEPLTITGSGEQKRDFVYVKDLAKALIMSMESSSIFQGEIINIGSGQSISINELADFFNQERKYIEARIEPLESLLDISLAKSLLDWQPTTSLKEGLSGL